MKAYTRLAVALIVPLVLTGVARHAQIADTPAGVAAAASSPTVRAGQAQPAQQAPARAAQTTPGTPAGTPGPATELLKLMAVDKPDFGIKVVQTFDARGKPAYETKGGDLLFITNASVSYNSTADKPMVIVIDGKARKIIAVADVDMPSTPHGITLSPDGKHIYIPSGPSTTGGRGRPEGNRGSVGGPSAGAHARRVESARLIKTARAQPPQQGVVEKKPPFPFF